MARHVVVPTALFPRIDTNVTRYHRGIVSSAAVPVTSSRKFDAGEVSLVVHDWGGDGHPVLLAHPTGFHGLTWAPGRGPRAGGRGWGGPRGGPPPPPGGAGARGGPPPPASGATSRSCSPAT